MDQDKLNEANELNRRLEGAKRDLQLLRKLEEFEVSISLKNNSNPLNQPTVKMSDYPKNIVKEIVEKAIIEITESEKLLQDTLNDL